MEIRSIIQISSLKTFWFRLYNSNQMTTIRRTLKEHLNQLPPILNSRKTVPIKKKLDFSDESENEYSSSEDEGTDEPDRYISSEREEMIISSSEYSKQDIYISGRTNCLPRRPIACPEQSPTRQKRRLYPNLREVENEERPRRHAGGLKPFVLIGIVFLVILSIFAVRYFLERYLRPPDIADTKSLEAIRNVIKRNLSALSKLTEQSRYFWVQIINQMNQLTEDSPLQPGIVLAIVPLDARKTAACLSPQILDIISSAFQDSKYISFDIHSHMGRNSTVLKHDLDEFFQGLNSSHAAGVYNLEHLIPEAAMIFHAYCDNENAPFKRAFLFMTMEVELSYSSLSSKHLDETAYSHLMELWTGSLREVDSAAIISRIANAPVAIQPEKPQTILELCPY